ncbi:NAD-dependent epimerase/dehydratase family protein [Lactiplantibacillus fabifermentans]|uniref:Enoyl reductase (ER) domain-containing protein n=2 Tax=Lactiplantibacillus fabifermentans TaxID=483011 RepID=A0A0R2NUR1_9LACO|nr:NAD-dependent epimerase/dehydratase family protein [Lactiplantibacillus fabifermentans]ETY74714.1 NADPH:quinone reductase [Lactiplantibacillus fabifermentans T30PCM01]KRO26906.1 hypothetical protein DY78_GL000471 [Lactiplantibacillus fabifermentans DSM 21115]
MQAIIQQNYHGTAGLQLTNVPTTPPGPISLNVKTAYTPVLPWDWRSGLGELQSLNNQRPPYVISYGFTGVVTAVGPLRSTNWLNQRVLGVNPRGSAREINQVPRLPYLFKVPDPVSLAAATTLIGGADAAMAVMRAAKLPDHATVLVTGATGGVGTALIQLLKQQQLTVIAVTSAANQAWIHDLGSDYELDYQADLTAQLAQVPTPSHLLDAVGQPALLTTLTQNFPNIDIWSLSLPHWQPTRPTQRFHFTNRPIMPSGYQQLLQMLADDTLKPIIREIDDFAQVAQAQQNAQQHGGRGRILLRYSAEN